MTHPTAVVAGMLKAAEALDVSHMISYMDSDIVYQNVPLPPARGIGAVEKQFRLMRRYCSECEVRIHNIAADGPIVLTERTDVIRSGAWSAQFWVCGTFEVRDGRIVLWRDYFDIATFLASSARGAGHAALVSAKKLVNRYRSR